MSSCMDVSGRSSTSKARIGTPEAGTFVDNSKHTIDWHF